MRRRHLLLAAVGAVCGALAGCADRGDRIVDPVERPDVATFARVRAELFTPHCTACHNLAGEAGLDLSDNVAYGATVGVDAALFPGWKRIVAGDPAASLLYIKVAALGQPGSRMPPAPTAPVDTALVSLLRRWIAAGAAAE
jgi:hypothetical protein